ncbi:hypothetical protein [Streptomyces sp. NPDC054804]
MDKPQDLEELLAPLRADLASLRTDSTALQVDLTALRTDSTALHVELTTLRRENQGVAEALSSARAEIDAIKESATATYDSLNDFVERWGRHQIVANAQAELTQLTVIWKADFAHRQRVRALARGLTHALTAHAIASKLVDQDTIDACVRRQFLSEPTYWLAPAIMAMAAWHTAEPTIAPRATAHAVWLDSAKAKLFFALTCSRQGRLNEAAGWMDRYLNSLDRDDLGPEFAVVLEAIANAELGYEAYTYAREAMARWFREERSAFQNARALPSTPHLAPWGGRLMELGKTEGSRDRFAALRELAGLQWTELENGWRTATALEGTLNFLESFPTVADLPAHPGRYTDSALDHLIDQLESDESEIQERMTGLRTLIGNGGEAVAEDDTPQDNERIDFVTLLERAVFQPELLQLGVPARRLALDCIWESVCAATMSMARTSRSLLPVTISLSVGDWSCEYSTDPSQAFDVFRAADDLTNHVEQRTHEQIESIVPAWSLTAGACALAAVDGALIVPFVSGGFILMFSIVMCVLILVGLAGIAHVPFRRRSVREAGERQRRYAAQLLGRAVAELNVLMDEWRKGLRSSAVLEEWRPHQDGEVDA